ncbi:MAG: addiction module protein [Candidatus Riflebacteria bacterium]|nr:addiction module protein [Candidatus Riflebacteria bacterium]
MPVTVGTTTVATKARGDYTGGMAVPLRKIYQQAVDLSQEDRELLTDLLLDTLASPLDPVTEAAWRPELDRRADELESGAVKAVPWSEVHERLKVRLHAKGKKR